MTACRNKASRAVTAALVGVLSVGAVPMVALASPAVADNGGASLMLAGDTLAGGEIVEAIDDNLDNVDLDGTYTIEYDNQSHYVKPVKVKSAVNDKEYKVGEDGVSWGIYKEMPDGSYVKISGNAVSWPGTYYAVAYIGSDSSFDNCAKLKFQIVASSLDDAYICDGTDADDKVIEYDGTPKKFSNDKLNLVVGGKIVEPTAVTVYKDGSTGATDVAEGAGKYVARVTYNNTTKDIPFEIAKLDVADAEVELNQKDYALLSTSNPLPTAVNKIGDAAVSDLASDGIQVTLSYKKGAAPSTVSKGVYTYVVTVKDPNKTGNVEEGSKDVTVVRYQKSATFSYDGISILDGNNYTVPGTFNAEYIKVRGEKTMTPEITYYKQVGSEWKEVDASATTAPGSYKATVKAVDSTYTYGGSVDIFFNVAGNPIADADIYLLYNGEVVSGNFSDVYNGEDFLDDFTLKAYDEDGELVDSSALEIVATNSDGDVVDSVVNADTYTIEVKASDGSSYEIIGPDTSLDFTVDAVEATQTITTNPSTGGWHGAATSTANAQLRLAGAPTLFGKTNTYAYTGEAVAPTFEYDVTGTGYATDYSATEWVSLPSDAYRVSYQKSEKGKWVEVEECVEPGDYQVKLSDNKREDNYKVNAVLNFTISDDDVFVDVDPDAYYAESVYQANKQGYVYGMGGTNMFAPNASMSRADMAVMLFRMAGGELRVNDGKFDVDMGYVTKFEDCDENAYYAKAVAWATQVGIVSGYDATHFGPADKVTTEQFAVMLANYAKAAGKYEKVDVDATLAEVSDGSSVSAFAREQVAWAVDNGYIAMGGAAISPQAEISRGRVVTIAVRYQPEVSSIVAEKPGDSNLPGNENGNADQKN